MPRTQFQKLFFAFVTVVITVHAYVFYSLYVIHGSTFIATTGASGVLEAINKMGGVPVLGHNVPIWAVVLIEFVLAYILEILVGSPQSFKIACHYLKRCLRRIFRSVRKRHQRRVRSLCLTVKAMPLQI